MSRALAMLILLSLVGPAAVAQDKKADANLTLSQGNVAVGVGYSWGKGTLSYQGKTYPVKVHGGGGATAMKNQNGVVIETKSMTQGVSLKLAAEGIKLSISE